MTLTGLALWVFALILFFLLDRVVVVVGFLIQNALGRFGTRPKRRLTARRRICERKTRSSAVGGGRSGGKRAGELFWPFNLRSDVLLRIFGLQSGVGKRLM